MFVETPTRLTREPTVAVKEARANRQQGTNSTICGPVEVSIVTRMRRIQFDSKYVLLCFTS